MSNEQQISVYDEFAVKHRAAFAAWLSIYEATNPRPAEESVERDRVSLLIVIGLVLVSIAAIIVSGTRTIDEFGLIFKGLPIAGLIIGFLAFIMMEGGIMAYAFFRARRQVHLDKDGGKKRLAKSLRWATFGLGLTIFIALAVNVDSTLRNHNIELPDGIRVALNFLVAVSAPTLAFISSDVLAVELMSVDIRRQSNHKKWLLDARKYDKAAAKKWQVDSQRWGVKVTVSTPQIVPVNSVNPVNLPNLPNLPSGKQARVSPKLQLALDWLTDHPNEWFSESRKLAETIGVSHMTVHKAQIILRGEDQ